MAKIRFLFDVHVHSAITAGMRRRGVEVLTCQEASLGTASDERILKYAYTDNWVVFSQDDDFLKICAKQPSQHKGLVYSHKRSLSGELFQD